jgi:hypothetical protein
MTDKTFDSKWLWAAAIVIFILGAAFAHFSEDFVLRYPLDEWRMDSDDMIGDIGTLFVGIAALIGLRRAHRKIDENGTKEHELEEREENDFQELRHRLDVLEQQNDQT